MGGLFRQYPMLGGGIANTRSLPATHRLYNPSPLTVPDAADGLADKSGLPAPASGAGVLLTADGGRYPGELFGAQACLLYTSPSPRDAIPSRMPSSA